LEDNFAIYEHFDSTNTNAFDSVPDNFEAELHDIAAEVLAQKDSVYEQAQNLLCA
jgi:hypothetical protein